MLPHELMASQSASSSASNAIVDKGLKYLEQGKRDEAKQCFQKAAEQGDDKAQLISTRRKFYRSEGMVSKSS